MITLILFLQLVALIGINVQLHRLKPDFSKEDSAVQDASRIVAEAKQRIPKE